MFILVFIIGLGIGALLYQLRIGSFQKLASKMLQDAERQSRAILEEAQHVRSQHEQDLACKRQEVEKAKALCQAERQKLAREREKFEQKSEALTSRLELVEKERLLSAALTPEQAKELILQKTEKECAYLLIEKRRLAEETADDEAKRLIITALGRMPPSTFFDQTCTQIPIQDTATKAKIIGRDGKNIKAFQHLTGVTVVLEEEACLLSSFDLERREIAAVALQELIKEGRIHPDTIEKAVSEASQNLEKRLLVYGQDAAERARTPGLHPELLLLLGRLSLRSSNGQNLLEHSVEVSILADLIASELRLDAKKARRIALLHDIGKASSREFAPTHAMAGRLLALRYGEDDAIANGIGAHHNEIPVATPEGALCKIVDALSASRRGARQEDHEAFFQKLKHLEQIALEFPAVGSAFALQAGKKLHVFVNPESADDHASKELAGLISEKIEQVSGGSKVEVTVIRNKIYTK